MFTKNYYKLLAYAMNDGAAPLNVITTSGSTLSSIAGSFNREYLLFGYNGDNYFSPTMRRVRTIFSGMYAGTFFGTGTTPPTIDDYKLSGNLITTISSSVSFSAVNEDGGNKLEAVYTLTNTGSSPITIGEVGLFAGDNQYNKVLVERTVLDEPITLPPDGVGQVTYTIRMVYPTE